MPLQINEIGISMKVGEAGEDREKASTVNTGEGCRDIDRDELVEDIVRRVIAILDRLGTR